MDMHAWTFADGSTRQLTIPPGDPSRTVLGLDADGRVVLGMAGGSTFGLTLCCNALDKGTDDGVVCRSCYGADDIGAYDPVIVTPVV
jgi:hypothetical protein